MRHSDSKRWEVRRRWGLVALALAAGVAVSACGQAESEEPTTDLSSAQVKTVKGSDLMTVTLKPIAIERLGLESVPVEVRRVPRSPTGGPLVDRKVVPYSAIIYDADGKTWVFVNTEGRTYMREAVTAAYEQEGMAILSAGPAAGTEVVKVGAMELYGAELGVDADH